MSILQFFFSSKFRKKRLVLILELLWQNTSYFIQVLGLVQPYIRPYTPVFYFLRLFPSVKNFKQDYGMTL